MVSAQTANGQDVVVAETAPPTEQFAAQELRRYLARLYKTSPPDVRYLVGSPDTNPRIAKADWPQVTAQGIVLKRASIDSKPALIVGGGSPQSTLWAVYELVERLGVRFLLDRDILPAAPRELELPADGLVLEPNLPIRQWRVMNAHACGPESWGLADYRPFIDQLAKLKFNRLFVYIWPWHPFVHFEAGGVRRTSGTLWFGERYPITSDMPGRAVFKPNETEFWNPDIPFRAGYEETHAAAERLLHGIMAHAHARGMQCVLVANLGEFPGEFAAILKGAQPVQQIGNAGTIVPGAETPVDDPALTELATAVLRATVQTYPEADFIELGMQEHRQWASVYQQAWTALDAKHGVEQVRPLKTIIEDATQRVGYPGGAERAIQEVKGDIVSLHFYDRLLASGAAKRKDSSEPRFVFDGIAEELFPVLPRIVPEGSELLNFIDYTPSRILKRRGVLANVPGKRVPSTLIYTLHDDNVGLLPQLATGSLHELTREIRKHGWAGFSSRYWLAGDHDGAVAYLSRAAWDAEFTPELAYADHTRAVYGNGPAAASMRQVFAEVEAATLLLEEHGLGFAFPTPQMMTQHWTPTPLPAAFAQVERHYKAGLDAAREAQRDCAPAGGPLARYWIGRLEFGIGYLRTVAAVRNAGAAQADGRHDDTLHYGENALYALREAIDAYAAVVRDRSDRGAVAVLAEYAYRPLKAKVEAFKKGK